MSDFIELMCKLMHESYEEAAIANGWQTQVRSRVAWADVPEANKKTMRVAVSDVIDNVLDYEQERIIKAIENLPKWTEPFDDGSRSLIMYSEKDYIALIKGENK